MSPTATLPPNHALHLHGALAQVLSPGMPAVALERKLAAMLAWLHHEGPTPRARVAALLWPDVDDERARANLRQRLKKLRAISPTLLTDDGQLLALAEGVQWASGEGVLLARFDYTDLDAFAQWLDLRRQAAQMARKAQGLAHARAAIQTGDLQLAQQAAQALLALDAESEDSHRLLMEALYLRGAYAEAITTWDNCRDMLRRLYGVPPSPATQALGQLILQAARTSREATVQQRDAMPLSLLRPPQMVGRSWALDTLLAGGYAGRVVCVSGPAGLGKSRLLAEWLAAVGGGTQVAARPGDVLQPYAALGRLLLAAIDRSELTPDATLVQRAARLLPALASRWPAIHEPISTPHQRRQCLDAVGDLLSQCALQHGTTLVFDDLQFADAASIDALAELWAAPRPGIHLAIGARTGEITPAGEALLHQLASQQRLTRVELEPLGLPEVTSLLTTLALPGVDAVALAPGLRQRVGGNPAFLLESLKLMLSMGPQALAQPQLLPLAPGIDAVVARRIGLLSEGARQVARLAAVAGPMFSPALAEQVLGIPLAELSPSMRELEQRQVLYSRRFVHDLVAQAALHATPPELAEQLHLGVAQALTEQGVPPAVVAAHWRGCGQWSRASACYVAAAEAARQALRPAERAQLLDAAADCHERAGDQAALFEALVDRLNVSDAPDRAACRVALMDRLDALASTPAQSLQALAQRVGWHADAGRQESLALGHEGMQRALDLGLPDLAFGFANGVAWQHAMKGQDAQALAALELHRPWVQGQGDEVQAEFHSILAGVHGFGDRLMPAMAHAEDAVALLRRLGRHERTLPMLSNMGLFRWWRGELDLAKATLLEAQVLRDRMLGGGASLAIDLNLASVLRDRGEYQASQILFQSLLERFKATAQQAGAGADPTDVVLAENHLADLWMRLGQPERAADMLQDQPAPQVDARFRLRRAVLRLRLERWAGAQALVPASETDEPVRALLAQVGSPYHRAWAELELARALPAVEATQAFGGLAEAPAIQQRPGLQVHALLRAARAALAAGLPGQAHEAWVKVVALVERCHPMDIERAELWLTGHAVLLGSGQAGAARQLLQEGAQWLQRNALHHMPMEWRDRCLRQHPLNHALLQLAALS
jgi:DNA-binding SARP family transcriptional activator/tetratricopeptide (TPR) repeat protein